MSKTIKNALLGFTLVCMGVLVFFVIELIVINRDSGGNAGSGQTAFESLPLKPDPTDDKPLTSPADKGDSPGSPGIGNGFLPGGNNDFQPSGQAPAPTGKRYELPYPDNRTLVVYADEETLEHTQEELADRFTYTGEGTATLLIHFVSLPLGAEREAENFLDGYLEDNESHVSGEGRIRRSSITGVMVTGVVNGETYEAWIHLIPDDDSDASNDIGMAFVINYSDDEQRNTLYAALDSLEIISN